MKANMLPRRRIGLDQFDLVAPRISSGDPLAKLDLLDWLCPDANPAAATRSTGTNGRRGLVVQRGATSREPPACCDAAGGQNEARLEPPADAEAGRPANSGRGLAA